MENNNLAVVLVESRNPLNIGAVARAMSNFGFFDLRLVRPYSLAFREAVSAVGATGLLEQARVYESVTEAILDSQLVVAATGLERRQPGLPLRRLELAARLIRRHSASSKVALLFGSEKHGLTNDALQHAHWLLHIPTRDVHESLNLAHAVAICLYELIRRPNEARQIPEQFPAATGEELDRLSGLLKETLQLAQYTDYSRELTASEKTNRLLRRLQISSKDAAILSGMLRQILWKINQGRLT